MKRSTFAANFWVSPSKSRKNGLCPINATITLNGERASFSTHKYIHPDDWDNVRQRMKGKSETAHAINTLLEDIKTKLLNKEIELSKNGYILTASVLRDAYLDKISQLQNKTLFMVFEEFLTDMKTGINVNISDDTYYIYERAFSLLKEYINQKHPDNRWLTFHEFEYVED